MKISFFLLLLSSVQLVSAQSFRRAGPPEFPGGGEIVAFSDLDGDGDNDVLFLYAYYENDGTGNFVRQAAKGLPGGRYGQYTYATGDVDGDGDLDVLAVSENQFQETTTRLYTNNGNGAFSEVVGIEFIGVSFGSIALADIDGDGDLDVLVTGSNDAAEPVAALYQNDGGGHFTEITGHSLTRVKNSSVAFSDVDGDGDQDLLITGAEANFSPVTNLYFNDGSGNFTLDSNSPFQGVSQGNTVFADVNNDGFEDIWISGSIDGFDRVADIWINNGAGGFTSRGFFQTHSYGDVAFADIDGDGALDLAVTRSTNFSDPETFIYKNNGLGDFTSIPTNDVLDVGEEGSLAFADADGDGDQDLINSGTTHNFNHITKLYFNDGTGTFTDRTLSPFTGVKNSDADFADVDGDGDEDVAITGVDASGQLSTKLYLNDGLGSYQEVLSTPFEAVQNSSLAFTDVDNDGDQDLLITGANSTGRSSTKLYNNDGSGSFTEVSGTPFENISSGSAAFSDIDGNGSQDLLLIGDNTQSSTTVARLYTNDGSGNFVEKFGIPFEPLANSTTSFSDIDNDGDEDVLLIGTQGAKLYLNDGSGNFLEKMNLPFDAVSSGIGGVADFDGDGDQDILISGNPGSFQELNYYFNDGSGNFVESPTIHHQSAILSGDIAFADLDNDDDVDFIITGRASSGSDPQTKLYINDGQGNFEHYRSVPFERLQEGSVDIADVDSDGDQDVLLTGVADPFSSGPDRFLAQLYINEIDTSFTQYTGMPLSGVDESSVAFSDIDNDGDLDALITGLDNLSQASTELYANDGQGDFSQLTTTSFEDIAEGSVAFSDVDGDGDPDALLTGHNSAGMPIAKLYSNNGQGTFSESLGTPFEGVGHSAIAFADVDDDGDSDVLITGQTIARLPITKMYSNNGQGSYTETNTAVFDGVHHSSIAFLDLDGDGDSDALITGENVMRAPISKLYTNDGQGNFSEVTTSQLEGVSHGSVAVADVDGDDDVDILLTGQTATGVPIARLYTNDGQGGFSPRLSTALLSVASSSVTFADLDGDGDEDLLLTGRTGSAIPTTKVYLNDGFGDFSERTETQIEEISHSAVTTADIDSDGDPDLLLTGRLRVGSKIATIYLNNSGGFSSTEEARSPQQASVVVFPNPTVAGVLFVNYTATWATTISLNLYNLQGVAVRQQIHQSQLKESTYPIDISAVPPGIYILEVRDGQQQRFAKVLVR